LSDIVEAIKALREETGAGIMDCKRALEESKGDLDQAREILRRLGIASAAKRATRTTDEGLVDAYVHSGSRVGAIVELNCETDFVARTPDFRSLAHDIAMQVAAMSPRYIDVSDVPDGEERDPQEVCLLQQPFIKDTSMSVSDKVSEAVGKLGENVRVKRFTRFSLGE
jgi:elongation factor Ts